MDSLFYKQAKGTQPVPANARTSSNTCENFPLAGNALRSINKMLKVGKQSTHAARVAIATSLLITDTVKLRYGRKLRLICLPRLVGGLERQILAPHNFRA